MKLGRFALIFLVIATVVAFAASNGYKLFQQGLAKERAEADLRGAIQIYEQVVSESATDRKLADTLIAGAVERAVSEDGAERGSIPTDMATASGSGLDPHISPANAELQVARVARARGLSPERVRELVARHTEGRQFGILGEPRVNVLLLNIALDSLD